MPCAISTGAPATLCTPVSSLCSRTLGFEAHLVQVASDHAAIIVRLPELNGEAVYVDIGSAAPLFQLDRSRSVSLKNNSLFITWLDGREEQTRLGSIDEMEEAAAAEFGLPRLPVRQAAMILRKRGVDIFSENA
ncbi:hypothetical protein [Brevibacillus borstelensis]|uniref:hypothetical protein n=1 Tax=Brevibacillus borstelensis TaxID=45462 RepID=UPI0030BBBAB8